MGAAIFPGPVGEAVAQLLDSCRVGTTGELIFEAPPALLPLPFEAARLPDGRLPALEPGVCVLRRLRPDRPITVPPWEPQAGPLKILVAVGAPDEGQTPNQVLDLEAELQAILDAVERANQLGIAQVRVLEVGHPAEIQRALTGDAFHVLHLSAHGSPGAIELETEDGAALPVSAAELAQRLRDSGRPLPLVFLSATVGSAVAIRRASPRAFWRPECRSWSRCRGRSPTLTPLTWRAKLYGGLVGERRPGAGSVAPWPAPAVGSSTPVGRRSPGANLPPSHARVRYRVALLSRPAVPPILDLALDLDPLGLRPFTASRGRCRSSPWAS